MCACGGDLTLIHIQAFFGECTGIGTPAKGRETVGGTTECVGITKMKGSLVFKLTSLSVHGRRI